MAKMTREEIKELADIIRAEENNQRPPGPLHDIRPFIPLTAQTNPAAFPAYAFRDYPKMMTRVATQADVDQWKKMNAVSDDRGGVSYRGAAPKVGKSVVPVYDELGEAIVVHSREEEERYLQETGQASILKVDVSAASTAEIARLEEDNKRLRDLIAENAALTSQLAAKPAEPVHAHAPTHKGKQPPANLKVPD
jgi:hypothetical protein